MPCFTTQFGSNRYPPKKECPVCKQNHKLETCKRFLEKPVAETRKIVLSAKLCFQCLSNNHFKRLCKSSKYSVKDCVRKRHELLHLPSTNDRPVTRGAQPHPAQANVTPKSKRTPPVQFRVDTEARQHLSLSELTILTPSLQRRSDQLVKKKHGDSYTHWDGLY